MPISRRQFVLASSAALAASRLAGAAPAKKLRILILGGTKFLGPELVEAARARGHTLTLFNRGKTNPQLFPDVEKLHGDRDKNDLTALKGKKWDAVIDTSGYVPRVVRGSATALKDSVKQYVFISSISVYKPKKTTVSESDPVIELADKTVEEIDGKTYGGLKALCEKAAEEVFPGRTNVIRPGLIVGPNDPTDRYTYWPVRLDRGGEVLAPGEPSDPVQIVDVRDLAAFTILCVEAGHVGVYNAAGPKETLTVKAMLEACPAAPGSKLTFVPAKFLEQQKVSPWSDMPVWVPSDGDEAGLSRIDCSRAIAKGLAFRPTADIARDTLKWWKTLPAERQKNLQAGITPQREAEVLAAWHRKSTKK